MWRTWMTTLLLAVAGASAELRVNRFPFDAISGNVTLEQLDTIMSLVSIAENNKAEWWENYDYCEDRENGRGYTVSLVGFCSGTSDLLQIVRYVEKADPDHPLAQFVDALKTVDGTDSTKGLTSLCASVRSSNDKTWQSAVWKGIKREYWEPATRWAYEHGLTSALAKGFLLDVALNHGAEGLDLIAGPLSSVDAMEIGEATYLEDYMNSRANLIAAKGEPASERVAMWQTILTEGNLELERPVADIKFKGDMFTIGGDDENLNGDYEAGKVSTSDENRSGLDTTSETVPKEPVGNALVIKSKNTEAVAESDSDSRLSSASVSSVASTLVVALSVVCSWLHM
ncbi:hypothetical protein Poli38472_001581 [Pythium oligandrum]|uniref:Chitosanase n=1 Tax=Pythium oligandrum TaxID=41045 RepID=A0A8K1CVG3_PYTOL|nr:hypothetical protein Poli38472_001581 [Pythium oligandrum]|eukprot:TMW69425.1 hypothetical protein Poli38472_001581 [Pythium oligandrum]